MTRKDYILIAECIAECHNKKKDLDDIIGYFCYELLHHKSAKRFNISKFKTHILEKTKPDHIPEEQVKTWARKKASKSQ